MKKVESEMGTSDGWMGEWEGKRFDDLEKKL